MKKLLLSVFIIAASFCFSQNKTPAPEIIHIKKYNVEKEIKDGSLSFLKGCFWTETIHVKNKTISTTRVTPDVLIGKRGTIFIENIKKKNPDGSFKTLPPKQ